MAGLRWDIFCRVIDNLGDAGVCWRLAADLAARGQRVRLVIDDAGPLRHIAPQGAVGVEVLPWGDPGNPGDVVIEAFGCDPPPRFVQAMADRDTAPCWLNLEYLSAEPYVERSHGLPSPQANGLVKHFFYPGFTPRTGGLLREPGLVAQRQAFDRDTWLASRGIARQPEERVATLFCYANAALPALLKDLARAPTLVLVTAGLAQQQLQALGPAAMPDGLRIHRLPWLTQPDFDRLLWAGDLNVVRGEDSLVRAVWAGAPFVWQLYPQHDGAHFAKLEALLDQLQPPPAVATLFRAWNGVPALPWPGLPQPDETGPWQAAVTRWRAQLLTQPDLCAQLLAWVQDRTKAGGD